MLEKFIDLVKGQVDYYQSQLDRFPPTNPRYRPDQVKMYQRLLADHKDLFEYLETQKKTSGQSGVEIIATPAGEQIARPKAVAAGIPSQKHADDFSDLPSELLEQLSSRSKKGQADVLVQIIADRGGAASLDDILIDLYRKTGEIGQRTLIGNKLYRLAKAGQVSTTEGRKGIFTVP